MSHHISHLSDSSFPGAVLDADRPILVDFYADWCGSCRLMSPVLKQLADGEPVGTVVGAHATVTLDAEIDRVLSPAS